MQEVWKKIDGFENYEVSTLGRVRNKNTGNILKAADRGKGYMFVVLCVNGKRSNRSVHRLVADTFIPNPDNKPQVNHKDETRDNNRVENLEWVTIKENNNYGNHNQKISDTQNKPIIVIYQDDTYEEYPSATIAAKELGLWQQNIVKVLKGRRKRAGGLRFEYIEGDEI